MPSIKDHTTIQALATKEEINRAARAILSNKKHIFTNEQGFDKTRFKGLING
jgi:hypothetical protein